MTQTTSDAPSSWLAPEELDAARERLPILYIDAIPVRVDVHGQVTAVGLLLEIDAVIRLFSVLLS